MFFVSLLCIALFSQAFAQQVPEVTAENDEESATFALMETAFAEQFPLPYKIINFVRIMLGIHKTKMMKFGMKVLEVMTELQELWKLLVDMLHKESPKAKSSNVNYHQYSNQVRPAQDYYYRY